ncbi:MAG: hypothetical protein K0Q66_684 [Chitinophagaceae bacterium]|jgi:hypothetical protein|nr:hypothetical protein [Chitinophagaceae bacterium]
MKKILVSGLVSGILLLIVSILMLNVAIIMFPLTFEEYYNETFNSNGERDIFFYLHPFVLSFALAWFWHRFKGMFRGNMLVRGIELGVVFALVATLPTMWITYSALSVSFIVVGTWFVYALVQACIAGMINSKFNP